jgi:ribonuclease P/MRP protein subunit POP5
MKLKILPSHMREKKRYLAFEAISEKPLKREEVISIMMDAAGQLYGSCGMGKMDLWVLKIYRCPSDRDNRIRGVIRCHRDAVEKLRGVMPTITYFKGGRVAVHTLGISGTIKSAVKKFII